MNKYRLKFTKTDKMIYIGHLDLLKFFIRLIKRARLPIAYSNGFNPHQQLTFAIPLSLGTSSIGEYLDIHLTEPLDVEEIKTRCNNALPLGIEILAVRELREDEKNCASAICAADYTVQLDGKYDAVENIVQELLAKDSVIMEREVKKKVKTVDIRPMIYELTVDNSGEKTVLNTRIATGSQGNLKIDLVLEYIYSNLQIEFIPYKMKILRKEMYRKENGEFVAL